MYKINLNKIAEQEKKLGDNDISKNVLYNMINKVLSNKENINTIEIISLKELGIIEEIDDRKNPTQLNS